METIAIITLVSIEKIIPIGATTPTVIIDIITTTTTGRGEY